MCITAARFGLSLPGAPAGGAAGRDDGVDEAVEEAGRAWRSAVGCAALATDALLGAGESALVVGPSGAGKTTVLRRIAGATPSRVIDIDAARFRAAARCGRPVVDLFTLPLDATLRLLAAAGLAEAPLLVRTARELSEGQRFRLRLALAMAAALRLGARSRAATLVCDEFCACLDAATAASVCIGLSRWLRAARGGGAGARLIVASPREDLRPWLCPQVIVSTSLYDIPEVRHALRPQPVGSPFDDLSRMFLDDARAGAGRRRGGARCAG